MCILSLDSSTLPSASMTPGKVRRAPGRAGELSAAILLWRQTPARRLSGELASSSAICRALPPPSILRACSFTLRAGEGDLLWRAATTEPRRANKRSSFDRLLLPWIQSSHDRLPPASWTHSRPQNFFGKFQRGVASPMDSRSAFWESYDCTLRFAFGPHTRWSPTQVTSSQFGCAMVSAT